MSNTKNFDDDPATIDDLRVIVREIDQLEQMGDHRIVAKARTALLRLFKASAAKLVAKHKRQGRTPHR